MKRLIAVLLLLGGTAWSSTTTLTGTIKDAQGNGVNGYLSMQLPIMAQDITTNVAVDVTPVWFRLVNGTITGGAPLFDVVNLQPQGLYYQARAYDSANNLVLTGNYYVTGASFNLGAATPTNVTTSNVSYAGLCLMSPAACLTMRNLNGIRYADGFSGADWCAKVQAADTDLGATHGEIWIGPSAGPINACATVPTLTAGHTLKFLVGGTYALSNTLTLSGNGSKLVGVGGGMGEAGSIVDTGVTLQATAGFPTATPVVKFHDITKGGLNWVNVDCNNVTNCVSVLYDSDNNPPSSQNTFENFVLIGFHHGFVMGVDSTSSANTPASCLANPNQLGCYQMDTDRIENWQLYGNCSDTTAVGFLVNSANGFQQGRITRGDIQCINIGARIVFYNGEGWLDNFNCGSPRGTAPECVHLDTNAGAPTNIFNVETEGTGWAHGIHDSSCNPLQTDPVSPWIANAWFGSGAAASGALIDGCAFGVSIATDALANTFQAGGTSHILALGDALNWCSTPANITSPGCSTAASGIIDYWWDGFFLTSGDVGIGGKEKVAKSMVIGSQTSDSGIIGLWLSNASMFTAPGTTLVGVDNNWTIPSTTTNKASINFSGMTTAAAAFTLSELDDFEAGEASLGGGSSITTHNGFKCGAFSVAANNNCINNTGAANNQMGTGTTTMGKIATGSNCNVNGASPAACGSAASGVVVVPTTTTTYTVNTTAVTANSRIQVWPITDNSGVSGAPTCNAPPTPFIGYQSGRSAGTSFTFTLPSTTGTSCWNYLIVD